MFEQLREKLEKLKLIQPESLPPKIDATVFNDPLAAEIEWTPLSPGGGNFRSHRCVETSPFRLEFKPMPLAIAVYLAVFIVGFAAAVFLAVILVGQHGFSLKMLLPSIITALIFTVFGVVIMRYGTRPIVFDTRSGFFWKGRENPETVFNLQQIKDCTELKNIHSLQILKKLCRTNNTSYPCYDLNLVLNDGSRILVISHANLPAIREDGSKIAAFLKLPIWDIVEQQ